MLRFLFRRGRSSESGDESAPRDDEPMKVIVGLGNPGRDCVCFAEEVGLALGGYRFRGRGRAGGHNGLKSVEAAVGSQDYARLRIGIAPEDPRRRGDLSDFVLDDFGKHEADVVEGLMPTLTQALELWTTHGITPVMNRFTGALADQDTGE